ncbi:tetratricopeptide repeat protein [Nonomuraea longicatena]|uniref:Tetratricopeptide repeat protein n=1 Tax=Nonomuraea longicatena TaxID=83682 RepID=A0ABN1NPF4_9ACTN
MTHYVVLGELWHDGLRAELHPPVGVYRDRVAELVAAYWEERVDGLAARCADAERDLGLALAAGARHEHRELTGLLALTLCVRGLVAEEGAAILRQALDSAEVWLSPAMHALALLRTGHAQEAASALAEADGPEEPYEAYVHALVARESDPETALALLDTACGRWDTELRLALFRHELAAELDRLTPQSWGALARALSEAGRYGEALEALEHADPADSGTLLLSADAFAALGRYVEAGRATAEAAGRLREPYLHILAADRLSRVDLDDEATAEIDLALRAEEPGAPDHLVRFGAAQILLSTGAADRALGLVREIRADLPDDPRLLALEGLALYGTGDLPACEPLLRRAGELLPGEPVLARHLGVALLGLGELEEAGRLLDAAVAREPHDSWVLAVRGELRRRVHDLPGAEEDLSAAMELGFDTPWVLLSRARALASADPDRALRLLDDALENAPDDAEAYAALGDVHTVQGRYAEAEEAFIKAQTLDPYHPAAVAALVASGLERWSDEQAAESLDVVADAVAVSPSDFRLRSALCDLLQRLDRTEELAEQVRTIIGMRPLEPEDFRVFGLAHSSLDNHAEAAEAFRQGLRLAPAHSALHANLGVELHRSGDREGAERELREAVALEPTSAFALSRLGTVLLSAERLEEAEEHLRRAFALTPGDPDLLLDLAEVLRLTGRAAEGLALAEEAARALPTAYALGSLGQLLLATGRPKEARQTLERAVELDPNLPWARGTLAETCRVTGDLAEAITHASIAIDQSVSRDGGPERGERWLYAVRGTARFSAGDDVDAESDLRTAVDTDDGQADPIALGTLRDLLQRTGRGEEAVQTLRGHALADGLPRTDRDPLIVVYLIEALQTAGHLEEAKTTADWAVSLRPEEAVIHSALAWVELALGRDEEALRAAAQGVALAPGDPERLHTLGAVQRATGDAVQAVGTLAEAVRLDREAAWIWAELTAALCDVGAWESARAAGLEATAEGRAHTAYCFEMLGWARRYGEPRADREALAAYERALELDPRSVGGLAGRPYALAALGERQASLEGYERLLARLDPKETEHLAIRAWALYRLGRFREALDFYQRFQALKPVQPDFLLFDMALLAWAEGDDEAARAGYQDALVTLEGRAPERARGVIDVAVRDLEHDDRGRADTRADLLALLRTSASRLPEYEPHLGL